MARATAGMTGGFLILNPRMVQTRKFIALGLILIGAALVLVSFGISSRVRTPIADSQISPVSTSTPAPPRDTAPPTPPSPNPKTPPETRDEFLHATLSIAGARHDLPFRRGETLESAMRRLQDRGVITFSGRGYSGLGFLIEEINGKKSADGWYWVYSINGVKAASGVSTFQPRPGDDIAWTYEKGY